MALIQATTKYGIVKGAPVRNSCHTIFKGIPYAKPPIRDLRFMPPQKPDSWEDVLACDEWAPMCFQEIREWGNESKKNPVWAGSEDCLYLNIWTPAQRPDEKLPVMFWIHGGGFYGGSSHGPHVDGEAYNKRGVILVSVGFRCGVFGFLGLEELAGKNEYHSTGNYGYMDIIMALRWVQENISAFGGDPGNVTIFGQSSGAMTVKMLLTCLPARGLFQRAISQSGGGIWDIDPVRTFQEKCGYTQMLLDMLGWTLDDLMIKKATEICTRLEDAFPRLGLAQQSLSNKLFLPSIDGYIVRDYYGRLLYNGEGADVDLMCGTIREEWHNFPHQIPGGIAGYEHEFALAPGVAWARRYAELHRKPVYSYFFDHNLPGDGTSPGHGSDIQFTFGTLDAEERPWTDYDYEMAETAVDYWISFAKTGSPATVGRPAWPAFTQESPVTMHFSNDGIRAEDLSSNEKVGRAVQFLLAHPGILSERFLLDEKAI